MKQSSDLKLKLPFCPGNKSVNSGGLKLNTLLQLHLPAGNGTVVKKMQQVTQEYSAWPGCVQILFLSERLYPPVRRCSLRRINLKRGSYLPRWD